MLIESPQGFAAKFSTTVHMAIARNKPLTRPNRGDQTKGLLMLPGEGKLTQGRPPSHAIKLGELETWPSRPADTLFVVRGGDS